MRDEDRRPAARHRRRAIAELRRDVDLDRDAGDPLEPVFGDEGGMPGRAAGDDRHPLDLAERKRQLGQMNGAGRRVDQRVDRVADDRRLLENLLLHKMAVIALADQRARGRRFTDRPLDLGIVGVKDRHFRRGDDRPVALVEISDPAGQRRQCQRVRAEEHLAVAIADRERAAASRADQEVMLAGKQKREREGAFEAPQGLGDRLLRRQSLVEKIGREDRHRLGVGLGLKGVAATGQFGAQRLEILDDAVVDDGDPFGRDRVGVGFGRQAMRRPAGVADADRPLHRLVVEPPGEIDELALGPPPLDAAVDQGRDPGRIIAAVFEPPQPFDQPRGDRVLGDDADNAAHQTSPLQPGADFRGAAGLVDLRRARQGKRVGRHIAGDDAAGGDDRPGADRNRRHKRGVGADKSALPDCRARFVNTVIIAGDRPGADIGPGPDRAVADVGEVVRLDPGPEAGLLDLDKIADMHALFEHGAGAQPRERADDGARADHRALDVAERLDPGAVADRDPGAKDDIGLDDDIAAEPGVGAEEHGFGCDQCRPGQHRPPPQPVLHQRLGRGEIGAGVDPDQIFGRQLDRVTVVTAGAGGRHDVGQVELGFRVVAVERLDELCDMTARERHDPAVDETDRELLRRRVGGFDNAFERAVPSQHKPAVGAGIARPQRRDHDRGIVRRRSASSRDRVSLVNSGVSPNSTRMSSIAPAPDGRRVPKDRRAPRRRCRAAGPGRHSRPERRDRRPPPFAARSRPPSPPASAAARRPAGARSSAGRQPGALPSGLPISCACRCRRRERWRQRRIGSSTTRAWTTRRRVFVAARRPPLQHTDCYQL